VLKRRFFEAYFQKVFFDCYIKRSLEYYDTMFLLLMKQGLLDMKNA